MPPVADQEPAISTHGRHFGLIHRDLDRNPRPRMGIVIVTFRDATGRSGHLPAHRLRSARQRFCSADSVVPMVLAASSIDFPASTAA